jgi:RNA polymerase sigma factor (sigma-70 family)
MSAETEQVSEEGLVASARQGDREAFGELCERYLSVVYNRLRAKLPPEAVEDVTQIVFIAAMEGVTRYRGNASFKTWLLSIARYKIADYYRGRDRQPDVVQMVPGVDYGNPDRDISMEERALVRVSLERLHEDYREVLLLRAIAREMGIEEW